MNIFSRLTNIGTELNLTKQETKVVRLLNAICFSWCVLILLFITTDYFFNRENLWLNVPGHLGQFLMLILVQFLQHKKKYNTARILFIASSTIQIFVFCNFLAKAQLLEFFYIISPLFSLLFLKKNFYHYFFLGIAIFCFSVVPEFFNIYPKPITSSFVTMPILFISVFLIFKYFKNENMRNELILVKERERIEKDKIKIEQQATELKKLNDFQTHFFVNITHELRTPLTLIKGNVFSAKKSIEKRQTDEKLDKIIQHSNKIENLISDIIDVTKAESNALALNPVLLDLNHVLKKQSSIYQSLFEENKIKFSYDHPDKILYANIDRVYFERVIGNVLINAGKYTSEGGVVTLKLSQNAHQLIIDIEDNGIGIVSGEEAKIFNRFYQVKNDINEASGSGIGLAFCKEIIQLLKGDISAFTNEKNGATFRITLPIVNQESSASTIKRIINIDSEKSTILLVDDTIEMREYLSSLLQEYNVIEAENGVEALKILEKITVDALITDYMMPKMNGYELVKEIKDRKFTFPVLVITAMADIKNKLDLLALGIDDYLTKPFVEEELIYRLQHSLVNAKNRNQFQNEEPYLIEEVEEDLVQENALIQKSRSIIEENIDNPLFGVPNLVEALDLTERTLYRKIKKSVGLTPNQFIREIKLLHVRYLVEQKLQFSLTELTKKVGLKNTSHLQKLYKRRFGTDLPV